MNIQDRKIGIIGLGYVGLPVLSLFSKKYKCWGFDIDKTRIKELLSGSDTRGCLSSSEVRDLTMHCVFSNSWDAISDCDFYIIIQVSQVPNLPVLIDKFQ